MIRRIGFGLLALVAALLVLPPLWFALFPPTAPELPPAGRRVVLPSGVGLNVVERGAGPAVVLIHGLPGSAYDWRELDEQLAARGLHSFAYDRVGYGRSDARTDTPFTVESNARELLGLLEALELSDATLVGWSYGGATAMGAAKLDPSRIGRLVLIGSAGPGIEASGPPPLVALLVSGPILAWLRLVPPLAQGLRASISAAAYSNQPQPEWWRSGLNANFALQHTPRSWREEGAALGSAPVPDTTGIALPVLVIHGADDWFVPLDVGRELAQRASNGKLVVIDGGSHMIPVTHPQRVAGEISAFAADGT